MLGRPSLPRLSALAIAAALSMTVAIAPGVSATGAAPLGDLAPGDASSEPAFLVRSGAQVFFTADDGTHGRELWVTDGTPAGTHLVKDIRAGWRSSNPGGNQALVDRPLMADVNGTLFFLATDGVHSNAIWKSDGTAAGTRFVTSAPGRIYDMVARGGKLLYLSGGLWSTTGTTTVKLKDATLGARGMWKVGSRVFFMMDDWLWRTDGTKAGTVRIGPSRFDNAPGEFVAAGTRVTFMLSTDSGETIWVTDGTAAGTRKLKVLASEETPREGVPIAGRSLYLAYRIGDIDSIPQLWVSDGTRLGSKRIKEFPDGHRISTAAVSGTGWIAVAGPSAGGFWSTDGTAAGTLKALAANDVRPEEATAIGTDLWFRGFNGTVEQAPMVFDTLTNGIRSVGDVICGSPYGGRAEFTAVGDRVVFIGWDEAQGTELWAAPR